MILVGRQTSATTPLNYTNVKDYGAVGGQNSTTAFQNAISAAISTGHRNIYIPATATPYLLANVSLTDSLHFFGDGYQKSLVRLLSNQVNGTFIVNVNTENKEIFFRDIGFDDDYLNQVEGRSVGSIQCNNKAGIHLNTERCEFKNVNWKSIYMIGNGVSDTPTAYLKVFNCSFKDGREDDNGTGANLPSNIYLVGSLYAEVYYNRFEFTGTPVEYSICALYVAQAGGPLFTRVTMKYNTFKKYARVIDVYRWAGDVDISENRFEECFYTGIKGKSDCKNVILNGNIFLNKNAFPTGFVFQPIGFAGASGLPTFDKYIISKNIMDNSNNTYTAGANYGIYLLGWAADKNENIIVSENIIKNQGNPIHLSSCKNVSVLNNHIVSNAGGLGIELDALDGDNHIVGNQLFSAGKIQTYNGVSTCNIKAHQNTVISPNGSGFEMSNINSLDLQGNTVKDVVSYGGYQHFAVLSNMAKAKIRNNFGLGTFAGYVSQTGITNYYNDEIY